MDSREQQPLPFVKGGLISEVLVRGLPVADYWMESEDGREAEIVFERKSLGDLWSTLTNKENHERFKKEVEKAKAAGLSIILIIEGSLSDIYEGNPRSRFKGFSMTKMLFTMWVRYNLMPVFCNDRDEMVAFITETFEAYGRERFAKKRKVTDE